MALFPGPFPAFQCCTLKSVEKLGMGLGMRLGIHVGFREKASICTLGIAQKTSSSPPHAVSLSLKNLSLIHSLQLDLCSLIKRGGGVGLGLDSASQLAPPLPQGILTHVRKVGDGHLKTSKIL